MPGGVVREMRADDHRVLELRRTASEAATRILPRVGVKQAHVKGLVAALAGAAVDPVALQTTSGGISWVGCNCQCSKTPCDVAPSGAWPDRRKRFDRRHHSTREPFASACTCRGG